MFRSILPLAANLYLVAFAVDAVVSLLDELTQWATGSLLLVAIRAGLAEVVFVACVPVLLALTLTPRLPRSILLPLALGGLWLNLGVAPLPIWIDSPRVLALTACGVQLSLAGWAFVAVRRRTGGRWLLADDSLGGPVFSVHHTVVTTLVGTLLLLPAAALYSLVYLATEIQVGTHGFIVFDHAGVLLADRRFQQRDREIQLVGMIHIGEQQAYGELFRSFATESTLVLAEGVSDETHRMQTRLSYAGAAANLGLAPQREIEDYLDVAREQSSISPEWPHVRNADVDVATFSPKTIEFLETAAEMWSSDDIVAELIERTNDPMFADPDLLMTLKRELIDDRNAQLVVELFDATADYRRVIIPWGALHLPAIEAEVIDRGYTLRASKQHRLITWSALLAALL